MNAALRIDPLTFQPGDFILCSLKEPGRAGRIVANVCRSKYTHAAICYDSTIAVHATLGGVEFINLSDLLALCAIAAVFRNPIAWAPKQILNLQHFLTEVASDNREYNKLKRDQFTGIIEEHMQSLLAKAKAYFISGQDESDNPRKSAYTCSELVASCFIASGFIEPSAATQFKPVTYCPGDLGKETVFGYLLGYYVSSDSDSVPADDDFITVQTYGEFMKNLASQ